MDHALLLNVGRRRSNETRRSIDLFACRVCLRVGDKRRSIETGDSSSFEILVKVIFRFTDFVVSKFGANCRGISIIIKSKFLTV